MHELFVLDETLPCDPGESPFQVRGVIYGRAMEHAAKLAGNLDAFAAGLPDPRVRQFAKTRFKWNGLYDSLPLSPIQIAISRLQGRDFETATRARSAEGAHRLIPSMFRLILGIGHAKTWAVHAPRLMMDYCGVGGLLVRETTEHRAVFEVEEVPQFVAAGHVNTILGIFEGTLSLLRVSSVSSRYFDVRLTGTKHGLPMLACSIEMQWQ